MTPPLTASECGKRGRGIPKKLTRAQRLQRAKQMRRNIITREVNKRLRAIGNTDAK